MNKNLPIPEIVEKSIRSEELIRVWISDGKPIISITSNMWKDHSNWGIILADIHNYISSIYETLEYERSTVERDIVNVFHAELDVRQRDHRN